MCLDCAIPFRGRVLCVEDAAQELGSPLPDRPRPQPSRRPEVVAGAMLVAALGATVPPWHGEGELTSVFSAWRPGLDPWAVVACLSLVAAAALAVAPLIRHNGPGLLAAGGYASLAVLAGVATAVTLVGAPDFFSPTPAPFATLGLAVIAAGVGYGRLRRLRGLTRVKADG